MTVIQGLFLLTWLAACGYAAARGGAPERLVAAAFVLGALISPLVMTRHHGQLLSRVDLGLLAVDAAMLIGIITIALVSTRFWPLWMASLQAVQVLGHLAKAASGEVHARGYYVLLVFWGFPMVALLALATYRHRRRQARYGIDPAWVQQLPAAYRRGAPADELPPANP